MYFSDIENDEIKHFHKTVKANFNTTLTEILHKTNGIFDNKLFHVEEIIANSLYQVYPLFYTDTVISSNDDDRVDNPRCLIFLKQENVETYVHFKTDNEDINYMFNNPGINAKSIKDSLTLEEYNALVYLLREKQTLTSTLNYKNALIIGDFGEYAFENIENQLRNNKGLIINNHLKNNPLTVKLTNPFFINAKYILTFTIKSLTGANICNNDDDNYKTTDTRSITLIPNTSVPLDLSDFTNDSVVLFDVNIAISFDVHEIVNNNYNVTLTPDQSVLNRGDELTLTAQLTSTGVIQSTYPVKFYEIIKKSFGLTEKVLIDTVSTDLNGTAILKHTPETAGFKQYSCEVLGANDSTTVTVRKLDTILSESVNSNNLNVQDTLIVTGTLEDELGNTLADKVVKLMEGNTVLVTGTTNNDGEYSLSYDGFNYGEYSTLRAVFDGDETYNSSSVHVVKITVKIPTRLIAERLPQPFSDYCTYSVKLVCDLDGTFIGDKKLKLSTPNGNRLIISSATSWQSVRLAGKCTSYTWTFDGDDKYASASISGD